MREIYKIQWRISIKNYAAALWWLQFYYFKTKSSHVYCAGLVHLNWGRFRKLYFVY